MPQGKDLVNVILSDESSSDELLGLANQYNFVLSKINKTKETYFSLDEKLPERKELGKDIQVMQGQINEIKRTIVEKKRHDPNRLNSFFRGVAGRCLPIKVYSKLLDYANRQSDDTAYEPPLIDVLTDEEQKAIDGYKLSIYENEKLKAKIFKAKKIIQNAMPSFIGEIDNEEYTQRVSLQKLLTSIIREL